MGRLVNRAKMNVTGTPGTGAVTLNAAVPGYRTFAAGGINDGDVVSYVIEDGANWEIGQGTYAATGTSLTRTTILASSNSGSAISVTSAAAVYIDALVSDLVKPIVRQTVFAAPLASGLPSFLPATSASLTLTCQNITAAAPLLATAALGWNAGGAVDAIGAAITNLAWTLTASNTNFLPVVVANGVLTAAAPVILAPIYQWSGTPSITSGQYTFNIAEMQMYLGDGASANKVAHVILGEAVAGASTITSTIAYALNGLYDSGFTATLPSTSTQTSKNSNMGLLQCGLTFLIECTSADNGYAVGDQVPLTQYLGSTGGSLMQTRNTVIFAMSGAALTLPPKGGGGGVALTASKWQWKMLVKRW